MHIRINLTDVGEVERAEKVVGDHLVRMANKDDPVVTWQHESDRAPDQPFIVPLRRRYAPGLMPVSRLKKRVK